MSIHVALHHRTTYRYERPVALGPQCIRLRPAPHCRTRILAYSLKVEPSEHFLNWQQDPQSNYIARLVFPKKTTELDIHVDLVAEMAAMNPFDYFLEPSAEHWPFEYESALCDELLPYRRVLADQRRVDEYVETISRKRRGTNDFVVELNRRLSQEIEYRVRLEPGLQSPDETLELCSGSCRDTGWLLVQILRRLGFAARFVSGYLIQLTADEKPLEGPAGPQADFVDLHAWCEIYLPGAGWIGLDPTSGLYAGEGHLPLACSAEPSLAAPVSGVVDVCETKFDHAMTVTRILEAPRVTKPYTDEQWRDVLSVGARVDAALLADDVRLTMGGEPTFVAAEDLDAPEWNTAALGPTKRKVATELFGRLRERYAPQGLVHFGHGKWYPGEPLPRWALNLYWRRDGKPLWKRPELVADEAKPSGATEETAARLLREVAKRLGFDTKYVFAAFEDADYYRWRESRLPPNVDPLDSRVEDPLERERLKRLFTTGLDVPAGWVLPVARKKEEDVLRTGPWHFRGGACYLVAGDSPLGLRLPLSSRPWVDPKDIDPSEPPDPSVERPPLDEASVKGDPQAAKWLVRTALCAEARSGVLYVFMPPVEELEDYVALLTAIEDAAAHLDVPVVIEGYNPPRDARLEQLSVTPDPGVIEVNIHPAKSWDELVDHTTHLYEAARRTRLAAEKFDLDGRHTGTGGGNHVVLGGKTAEDSPFLRRPDLLRSLVAYFHQHPSLSFLFSGLFIGPTSQAPRIDEARNDSLFELEIAFREMTRKTKEAAGTGKEGAPPPPWLVDRLFRDLLVDVTGNTHRAEFCIDKMYSPDGPAGRHGLLELRALEMPPHARMSLTQQLLLRALVARFWKTPYAPERLARWGTEIHDRFMLPFYVWQDFEDVLAEIADLAPSAFGGSATAGFPLRAEWFAPHFEFRFPKYGDVSTRGIEIELRAALEPWHVLGEDQSAGGTARYVDSSLERLQVRVTGMAPDRFGIAVNGVRVPLRETGRAGDYVAGIRFRAWQPPRCLHPHIEVHAPLRFDLVDLWMERSIAGCEYHVAHPGGRNYDTRPINALEAEGRRRARFSRTAHTPGKIEPRTVPPNPDFPFTLDLRRS